MLKRHEIEILLKAGHGKAEVARLSGASLRTVKRIAQQGPVVHSDDAAERAQRQIGRPSRVATFRKQVTELLRQAPDPASLEILRRVRESGYQGGMTALYALVASLRPKPARPLPSAPGPLIYDFGTAGVSPGLSSNFVLTEVAVSPVSRPGAGDSGSEPYHRKGDGVGVGRDYPDFDASSTQREPPREQTPASAR